MTELGLSEQITYSTVLIEGISNDTFFKLCSFAPTILILSAIILILLYEKK